MIERESRANASGSAAPVARLHDVSLRYGKTRALDAVTLDVPAGVAARAILEPDLVEWNHGKYEGLTPEQIHEQTPCWLIFRDGCPVCPPANAARASAAPVHAAQRGRGRRGIAPVLDPTTLHVDTARGTVLAVK